MKEKYMKFGDYIRKKRLADPRGLTMQNVADNLGISLSYVSAVENRYKPPFDGERIGKLAEFLNLSKEETALMFDLASRENREVPYDIEDIFIYEEIGELARLALRESKAGNITKKDWETFIKNSMKQKSDKSEKK